MFFLVVAGFEIVMGESVQECIDTFADNFGEDLAELVDNGTDAQLYVSSDEPLEAAVAVTVEFPGVQDYE